MTAWGTYRDTTIRYLLKDTQTTKTWSNAELLTYANWALRDLALVIPAVCSLTLTGSGPEYILPEDFVSLQSLSLVADGRTTFLAPLTTVPGQAWAFEAPTATSTPLGFLVDYPTGGTLYLTRLVTASTLRLVYTGWPVELTGDTSILPLAYQRWAEQALACYICYCAHLREGVGRAALEQWSQRPDLQVANPLNVEAAEWLKAYKRLVDLHRTRG